MAKNNVRDSVYRSQSEQMRRAPPNTLSTQDSYHNNTLPQSISNRFAKSKRALERMENEYSSGDESEEFDIEEPRRPIPGAGPLRVILTGFTQQEDERMESYVRQLGGKVVEDPMRGTHLITPRVKRTLKFLVILNRGIPILPPLWLQECAQERRIKNPDLFLLKDIESEKKFGFKLSISQEKALSRSFLDN